MKALGLILFGVLIGAMTVKLMQKPVPATPTEEAKEWAEVGVERIERMPEADQLKAAEEYYGKAVVLFLASLNNRLITEDKAAKLAEPIVKEVPPSEVITEKESAQLAAVVGGNNVAIDPKPVEVTAQDKALSQMVAYRKTPLLTKMTPQVRRINGSFDGSLTHEVGKNKGRIDPMQMDINFYMREGKLEGEVAIVISDPAGKVYSRKTGNGKNQTVRLVPGKKNQIYVEPAPGDFIQLDLSNGTRLNGRYYDADGNYVGRVQLWRK